jgi:hypothetical protein
VERGLDLTIFLLIVWFAFLYFAFIFNKWVDKKLIERSKRLQKYESSDAFDEWD